MSTKTFEQVQDQVTWMVEEMVADWTRVNPNMLGLDMRVGSFLYVDDECTFIACRTADDRTLQYYGGFEYVDNDYRMELPGYVLYSSEDDRVADHLATLERNKRLEDEENDKGGICPECNGSGEGMHDGSTCSRCGGGGEV